MSKATQPELTMRPAVEGDGTFIMRGDRNVAIVRQHADAVLFAAAPELLAIVTELASVKRAGVGKDLMARAKSAIANATEAAP